ncbi:MAG: M10 family metallopeptidase C-terminal domain-containing protein [Pseudomonadota bacterium]
MATIDTVQDQQISYIGGVGSSGLVVGISFGTWNYDNPPTYDGSAGLNYTAKFGAPTSGTGASITYQFDGASLWTATERDAFVATSKLWSAVANVTFVESTTGSAQIQLVRGDEDGAFVAVDATAATTGTNRLGVTSGGRIEIDTSVNGFGPLGGAFSLYGGYPYTTLIHEWGHLLGLGHGGPYNEGDVDPDVPYTAFDSLAWTVMSYFDPDRASYDWGASAGTDGLLYRGNPTTWMPLDIIAIQRLYGVAVDTPLSGGQTYGFNSNIQGDIGDFFDFRLNAKPVVTLWNKGDGNTLDVSGFTLPSTVDLHDGAFSSTTGLTNNIAIAYGTRIDTLVTGFGNDIIIGNENGNVIYAGGGADSISGGAGNDHLYGAAARAISGDGADTISSGQGNDYIQGNAGDDRLDGGEGSDRIQGGQGNDSIIGNVGNDSINGNLGNDMIDGGAGNDSLRGGQGNDNIAGGVGNDVVMGDLGGDTLQGGAGIDILTGGGDADVFQFANGDAAFATGGPLAYLTDMITDFTDGIDHLRLGFGIPTSISYGVGLFTTLAEGTSTAQTLLNSVGGFNDAAVVVVGGDLFLFYDPGTASPIEAIKLGGLSDLAAIGIADFI